MSLNIGISIYLCLLIYLSVLLFIFFHSGLVNKLFSEGEFGPPRNIRRGRTLHNTLDPETTRERLLTNFHKANTPPVPEGSYPVRVILCHWSSLQRYCTVCVCVCLCVACYTQTLFVNGIVLIKFCLESQ